MLITGRSQKRATYLGTDVRYVKTLDTISSGTSLKLALSGRVIIQDLSFPRPPGKKTRMLPWVCFQGGSAAKLRSTSQVSIHPGMAIEDFFHHQKSKTGPNPASGFKHSAQVVEINMSGIRYSLYLLSELCMGQQKKPEKQGQISTLVWNLQKCISKQNTF